MSYDSVRSALLSPKVDYYQPRLLYVDVVNCDIIAMSRDDGSDGIIQNFKASELHLWEWREVMQAGTILNEPSLGMILFNSHQRQNFRSIKDSNDLNNEMLYNVQEIFFRLHKGPGTNDLARTFSTFLDVEVNKRNLNPLKQMKVIEQLRRIFTSIYVAVQKRKKTLARASDPPVWQWQAERYTDIGFATLHGPYAACATSATVCAPVVKLKRSVSPTVKVSRDAHVARFFQKIGLFRFLGSITSCEEVLFCAIISAKYDVLRHSWCVDLDFSKDMVFMLEEYLESVYDFIRGMRGGRNELLSCCEYEMIYNGRSSYGRAMIELRADVELEDTIMVAMPKLVGERFYVCNILVEYEWKAPRIDKLKRQIIEGKLTLVDDDGKPLPKVVSTENANSDSEVEDVVDDHAVFIASTGLKRGDDNGMVLIACWNNEGQQNKMMITTLINDALYEKS
nr:hypothetical protein [Tanacetum cinerariifolium]